jgi:hypothetical protein
MVVGAGAMGMTCLSQGNEVVVLGLGAEVSAAKALVLAPMAESLERAA